MKYLKKFENAFTSIKNFLTENGIKSIDVNIKLNQGQTTLLQIYSFNDKTTSSLGNESFSWVTVHKYNMIKNTSLRYLINWGEDDLYKIYTYLISLTPEEIEEVKIKEEGKKFGL